MSEERLATSEKLARDLESVKAPRIMIERARNKYYDDYLSPLADPIVQLVNDAHNHGLNMIAQDAMDGKYDGSKEESDAWAASADGQATFAELGDTLNSLLRKREK